MTLFRSKDDLVTLLRGAGGTLAIKLISALLLFTVQIVLARILGVESYGVYVIAQAWLLMMLLIGRQGFDLATVRYVAAYQSQRQWPLLRGFLGFSRKFVFSTAMIVGACLALGAWSLRAHYSVEIVGTLVLAAMVLPIFALVEMQESALRGLNLVVRAQPAQAILNPIVIIVCLPLAVFWLKAPASAETAMAIYLGATVISLTCVWIMLRRHLPGEVGIATPEYRPREWISASLAMMFLMGFVVLMNQVSLIVIGALQDSVTAGLYGAASRIASTLQLPAAALGAAIGPMAADFHARGDLAALQRITCLGVRATFGLTLFGAIGLAVFGHLILGLLGEEFITAYPIMMVLVAAQVVLAAVAPAGILLNMTGYQNDSAKIMFICAVGNIVLLAVLIPPFGALGAAIATSVTLAAWAGLLALAVFRRINIIAAITLWPTGATERA
ncbi:MAG: oligosaccharide flippase family protein [Gammaproteobacteria bacterium]|nr:oligosaccharide flippase family protein [Gammaproteobacteria bacterium]